MSEDALSAEAQQEPATREARIEQALRTINAHTRKIQQEWGTIRRVYKDLHLEDYLLTQWRCDACLHGLVVHSTPIRKRCPKCQGWMCYVGLVKPRIPLF